MRIAITGAGGFVGRALTRRLQGEHTLVLIDHQLEPFHGAHCHVGDLGDKALLSTALADGCDALVHLATVPGGAAEADPAEAWRVNIDSTMAVIDHAQQRGNCPRVVFASSIAVLGDALPPLVTDATALAPKLLYGAHKAMCEQWIDCLTRRGTISGVSLRLPGILARPPAPSGMISAFMSNVFHALRTGSPLTVPVSRDATMWLMSRDQVVANFVHALESDMIGAMTLPALHVRFADLVAEIARQFGQSPALIDYSRVPDIETAFGSLPMVQTSIADEAGYRHDGDTTTLVARVLADLDKDVA